MRILVIRHGESKADFLNVYEGRADFELTDKGHLQAISMSSFVKEHYSVGKIYCSPLKRAYQTATHLAQALSLPLKVEDELMEFNNGLIAGLARDIANEKYPQIENLPMHLSVYEQESMLEFRFRADFILAKIVSENDICDTIAVVSHGGMINQLFHSFINAPVGCEVFYTTGDTGINEWLIEKNVRKIICSNSCYHTL